LKGTRNCIGRIEEIGGEDKRRNDELTNNVVDSEFRPQGLEGSKKVGVGDSCMSHPQSSENDLFSF